MRPFILVIHSALNDQFVDNRKAFFCKRVELSSLRILYWIFIAKFYRIVDIIRLNYTCLDFLGFYKFGEYVKPELFKITDIM